MDLLRQRSDFRSQSRLFGEGRLGLVKFKGVHSFGRRQTVCACIETGAEQNKLLGRFQRSRDFVVDPLGAGDACGSGAWGLAIQEPLN